MSFMFADSALFNVDLSSWDLSSVDNMAYMFYRALSFDQDLCWDVSGKVTESMFAGSTGGSIKQCCSDGLFGCESLNDDGPYCFSDCAGEYCAGVGEVASCMDDCGVCSRNYASE